MCPSATQERSSSPDRAEAGSPESRVRTINATEVTRPFVARLTNLIISRRAADGPITDRGDTSGGCAWYRKKSLCCTPNADGIRKMICDVDLCQLDPTLCDENPDYLEIDEGESSLPSSLVKVSSGASHPWYTYLFMWFRF